MNRLSILQILSNKIKAQKYLEIGVYRGFVFNNLDIPIKIGVDPDIKSPATFKTTSDIFFSSNKEIFDLIFIDGLHYSDQVEKDIINGLKFLSKNGFIVCHDMLPSNKLMQEIPQKQGVWTGDCWKAWAKIRSTRSDLNMYVVDTDYGCGIISYGQQNLTNISVELTYENFCKFKNEWMNIVSVDEFHNILNSME